MKLPPWLVYAEVRRLERSNTLLMLYGVDCPAVIGLMWKRGLIHESARPDWIAQPIHPADPE